MTGAEQALADFEAAHRNSPARWTTAELEQHNRLIRAAMDEKLPLDADIARQFTHPFPRNKKPKRNTQQHNTTT